MCPTKIEAVGSTSSITLRQAGQSGTALRGQINYDATEKNPIAEEGSAHVSEEGPEAATVPGMDPNKEQVPKQVAKWTGESKVSGFWQFVIASSWIGLMGGLPLLLPVLDHEPLTRSQMAVGALLVVTVFGGFYLFTNIILFQSIHFDRIRSLTVVECIYLMSQIITTVGYGDITPAYPRGMLFVALYVLGALFVIAMLVSELIEHLFKAVETYKTDAMKKLAEMRGHEQDMPDTGRRRQDSLNTLMQPQKPNLAPLLQSIGAFLVIDVCWILFFHLYPGEGKTWMEAAYMSLITLSSVGFGFFTPVTEEGMIFGAFMMLFGTAALVNVISNFTALMVMMKKYERMCNMSAEDGVEKLEQAGVSKGDNEITELQFLRFGLLRRDLASESEIDSILEAFKAYGPKQGKVSKQMVQESLQAANP